MNDISNNISLRDLQTWMKWIITDPRGVNEALAEPAPMIERYQSRYTEPSLSALKFIAEQPPLSTADRLSIYAEAYFARLLESLETDFPLVRQVLGEFRFQKLAAEYLKEYPSQTFNIGEVGKNLAGFISRYEHAQDLLYLTDLANMEWQLIEVFYAIDEPDFDPQELNHLTEKDWPHLVLKINSSVKVMTSPWPLDEFWNSAEDLNPNLIKRTDPNSFFLLRLQNGALSVDKISALEAMALECFARGQNLSQTLEKLNDRFGESDIADLGSAVMELFGGWIHKGMIANIQIK